MNRSPWCVATTMPSNRSRSLTSSTCSSVPIFVPERDSTGVPRVAAWYEIGVPSAIILTPSSASTTILPGSARSGPQARRSRDSAPRERRAETAKLGGRAAEGELVPLGRGEVPVQPVTGVDAHAAMDMDRGVRDPVAGLGRPELGGRDRLVTRQAGLEPPGGLPHRQPDRLDVDVGVGQPLRHRLERPDRPAELLPGPGVLGGQLERPLSDAELERADPDGGTGGEPARDRTVGGAEQAVVAQLDRAEVELSGAGPVGELLGLHGYPAVGWLDAE